MVGLLLGLALGEREGAAEGALDGLALGAPLGASVGLVAAVGSNDGLKLGLALGHGISRHGSDSLTDTLSGWDIASANAQEFVHLIMDHDALSGGGGAFDEYLRVVDTFGINMEEYQKVSAAEQTAAGAGPAGRDFFPNRLRHGVWGCLCTKRV